MKQKGTKKPKSGFWARLLSGIYSWYASNRLVLHFSLIFGVCLVLFYSLSAGPAYDQFLVTYLNSSARLVSELLNLMGQHTLVSGLTLEGPEYAFTVQRGCDAVEPSWFFLTAVIAFPAPITKKLLGVLLGVVILNLMNLVRIGSLFLVGTYSPSVFNQVHVEVWPAAFIIISILLWLAWVAWTRRNHVAH